MPNCDFNRPCTCIYCRTIYEKIECPKCHFINCVAVERIAIAKVDRKGIGYYDFEKPKEPNKNLKCFKCEFIIKNVGYFSEIALEVNEKQLKQD